MPGSAPGSVPVGVRLACAIVVLSVAVPVRAEPSVGTGSRASSNPPPLELRIVTYNTHGLPGWIARDRPERRFPIIGRLLSTYDVAMVQEDFAHHQRLLDGLELPTVVRGNPGSGLTLLLRHERHQLLERERKPYGSCSGWLLGASDCFADKGYLRVRLALPNHTEIDLVNTHLDAGGGEQDRMVRRRQLRLLANRIREANPRGALVVGGDLNLRWDQPRDRELLDSFVTDLGLVDSRARASDGSGWERIDYLLYRSSPHVRIEAVEGGVAEEFAADGAPLSDHPALWTRLRITPLQDGSSVTGAP